MAKKKRFIETYLQAPFMDKKYNIIVDTETGVNYLLARPNDDSAGLTVLLDKDGKPVVSDVSNLKND